MSLDIFLKVDGIEGESRDRAHPNEIAVLSFAWDAVNAAGSHGGGGAAGKVQIHDLRVVKLVDKASPKLFLACASGQHIAQCVLSARRAAPPGDFLTIRLTDCTVTGLADAGAHESGTLQETVTIGFSRIVFEYKPQRADGSFDTAVAAGWDLKTNHSV